MRRQNRDPHLLFSQLGERLGLVPEMTVSAAFANIWAQTYGRDAVGIIEAVRRIVSKLEALDADSDGLRTAIPTQGGH